MTRQESQLSLIEDPRVLTEKAVQSLANSLAAYHSEGKKGTNDRQRFRRYKPRILFRLWKQREYTIAIVPFFNSSKRKRAGEIMVLHFVRQLKQFENFDIIEPGIIRQEFLRLASSWRTGYLLLSQTSFFGPGC
jgi:hypothetical protein